MKIKNELTGCLNKKNAKRVEDLDAYDLEEDGFAEGEINMGKSIATFSFGTYAEAQDNIAAADLQTAPAKPIYVQASVNQNQKSTQRGATPPVNGEGYTVKRCYQYRPSTIRKLNELKARHPDVNVYLNTIIDEAISHYYNHVFNEGGSYMTLEAADNAQLDN